MKLKLIHFKSFIFYGAILGLLMVILAWSRYRFTILDNTLEIYIFLLALVFISVGVWAGWRLAAPKIIEKTTIVEVPVEIERQKPIENLSALLEQYNISSREYDVLSCLSKGLSNDEIADKLCVSANTVKTHLANLYTKLDVKRRTQAVEKARSAGLIG